MIVVASRKELIVRLAIANGEGCTNQRRGELIAHWEHAIEEAEVVLRHDSCINGQVKLCLGWIVAIARIVDASEIDRWLEAGIEVKDAFSSIVLATYKSDGQTGAYDFFLSDNSFMKHTLKLL